MHDQVQITNETKPQTLYNVTTQTTFASVTSNPLSSKDSELRCQFRSPSAFLEAKFPTNSTFMEGNSNSKNYEKSQLQNCSNFSLYVAFELIIIL